VILPAEAAPGFIPVPRGSLVTSLATARLGPRLIHIGLIPTDMTIPQHSV